MYCEFLLFSVYIYLAKNGPKTQDAAFKKISPKGMNKTDFGTALRSCRLFDSTASTFRVNESTKAAKYLLSSANNVEGAKHASSADYTNKKTFQVRII